jgi:hypothetical protein
MSLPQGVPRRRKPARVSERSSATATRFAVPFRRVWLDGFPDDLATRIDRELVVVLARPNRWARGYGSVSRLGGMKHMMDGSLGSVRLRSGMPDSHDHSSRPRARPGNDRLGHPTPGWSWPPCRHSLPANATERPGLFRAGGCQVDNQQPQTSAPPGNARERSTRTATMSGPPRNCSNVIHPIPMSSDKWAGLAKFSKEGGNPGSGKPLQANNL